MDNITNIQVDVNKTGKPIWNIYSNINTWTYHGIWEKKSPQEFNLPFVEYIQFMAATGGEYKRDLFKNPKDRSILDDYDFTSLINACKNVVTMGLLPHIKTGSVPEKFSTNPFSIDFGTNVLPPDDMNVYYNYIKAMAEALSNEFGKDEVLKWRFGVMVEYENRSWFTVDNDPDKTEKAYCRLYDYTVAALQEVIGENVCVGAHSMSCIEGLWPEEHFIEHCAKDINEKTGKKGTRLCFLSVSYYDRIPGSFNERTLTDTINIVRNAAEGVGLQGLIYGVDEGHILSGTDDKPLGPRAVGQTYQAAHDAKLAREMLDSDINYFSRWGYTSNNVFGGVPSVAMHTAELFYKMKDSVRVGFLTNGSKGFNPKPQKEINGFSAADKEKNKLYTFIYSYNADINAKGVDCVNVSFNISKPKKVKIYKIDDNCNFFCDWEKDRKEAGITDEDFEWSKDSFVIPAGSKKNKEQIDLFNKNFKKYTDKAILKTIEIDPSIIDDGCKNGAWSVDIDMPYHSVYLLEIDL
ncbi:MAG: hypothetical protein K0S55_1011 [Clostridia bacterium]|nr:hypothetical protein [Clostridia bacterium]